MAKIETKKWWESKTVWGVILMVIGIAYGVATGDMQSGVAAAMIGQGLALLGIRTAEKKIE